MKGMLIGIILIYSILIIPLCAITPLSFMAFDAPESIHSPLTWFFVLTFFSIPLLLLVSIILQGIFVWRKNYKTALLVALIPWIPVSILVALFTFTK